MKLFLVLSAILGFAAISLSGTTPTLVASMSSKVQPKEVTLGKDAKATGTGQQVSSVHARKSLDQALQHRRQIDHRLRRMPPHRST
jgi:hypothetical protein